MVVRWHPCRKVSTGSRCCHTTRWQRALDMTLLLAFIGCTTQRHHRETMASLPSLCSSQQFASDCASTDTKQCSAPAVLAETWHLQVQSASCSGCICPLPGVCCSAGPQRHTCSSLAHLCQTRGSGNQTWHLPRHTSNCHLCPMDISDCHVYFVHHGWCLVHVA